MYIFLYSIYFVCVFILNNIFYSRMFYSLAPIKFQVFTEIFASRLLNYTAEFSLISGSGSLLHIMEMRLLFGTCRPSKYDSSDLRIS